MIKTFRGLLTDSVQQKIRLSTKNGKTGYRIIKLDIIPEAPIASEIEAVVKIFKITQTSLSATVDFSDGNLLGCAVWWGGTTGVDDPQDWVQIFDREIFNQDIFVTGVFSGGTFKCNYYLELETINMTDNAAAVSTLRDIRLNPQVGA